MGVLLSPLEGFSQATSLGFASQSTRGKRIDGILAELKWVLWLIVDRFLSSRLPSAGGRMYVKVVVELGATGNGRSLEVYVQLRQRNRFVEFRYYTQRERDPAS